LIETQVQFARHFEGWDDIRASSGKILMDFFRFYCIIYPKSFPIINVSYTGEIFVERQVNLMLFKGDVLKEKIMQHYFLIREPFNHTYNPAKNIHR
jgi:hypothetical protein